jgi:hypothetical protein
MSCPLPHEPHKNTDVRNSENEIRGPTPLKYTDFIWMSLQNKRLSSIFACHQHPQTSVINIHKLLTADKSGINANLWKKHAQQRSHYTNNSNMYLECYMHKRIPDIFKASYIHTFINSIHFCNKTIYIRMFQNER